jgi:hypothetical protein
MEKNSGSRALTLTRLQKLDQITLDPPLTQTTRVLQQVRDLTAQRPVLQSCLVT